MTPFDDPDADVVEVVHGPEIDVVSIQGVARAVAHVSVAGGPTVFLRRRRRDLWRCAEDGYQRPPCRHASDVLAAVAHLTAEDNGRTH